MGDPTLRILSRVLLECVNRAMAAKHVTPENTFRYMCGIAWKKVGELREIASAIIDTDKSDQNVNPINGDRILCPAGRTVQQALREWRS